MDVEGAPYWDGGVADPPFVVSVADVELTVPRTDTGWWLGTLAAGNWPGIFHLIDRYNDGALSELIADDEMDEGDAHRLAATVAETVAGCAWPMAVRLAQHATHGPWIDFAGPLASVNPYLDPFTSPVRQVLAALWALIVQGCKDETTVKRTRAQYQSPEGVNAPPNPADRAGAPIVSGSKYKRFSEAEAAAAFRAASGERVGG